jgi:hypothetical protein
MIIDFSDHMEKRLAGIEHQLRVNTHLLMKLLKMETAAMKTLNDLVADTATLRDAAAAYVKLSEGVKAHVTELEAKLADAQANSAPQAVIDEISNNIALANATLAGATAVVVNTPVDPAAPADPATQAP